MSVRRRYMSNDAKVAETEAEAGVTIHFRTSCRTPPPAPITSLHDLYIARICLALVLVTLNS